MKSKNTRKNHDFNMIFSHQDKNKLVHTVGRAQFSVLSGSREGIATHNSR